MTHWCHAQPQEVQTLTQRMAASSSTHPLSAPQLKAAADALSWSDYRHPLMYNSASTLLNSGPGDRDCPSKVRSMSGYGSWGSRSSSGSSSGSTSSMEDPLVQGNGLPTLLELEKACRLSFAALHSLPQGNLQVCLFSACFVNHHILQLAC